MRTFGCLFVLLFSVAGSAQEKAATPAIDLRSMTKSQAAAVLEKARSGDAASQNLAGMMYIEGLGAAKDLSEGLVWFRKAAEAGYAEGEYNLALMYERGEGTKQDCPEAVKWYSKAVQQNHVYSIDNLIAMYDRGDCVEKDAGQIARLTQQLAELGSADAQLNIGSFYAMGYGVSHDDSEAGRWFVRAAEQGQPTAQFMLGQWFRDGKGGIPKDYVSAYKWFALSLRGGGQADGTGFLKSRMTPEQIAEAEKQADQWTATHVAAAK